MTSHTVVSLTTPVALEHLRPEWEELFRSSGTTNPFLHPGWQLAWSESFVRPSELIVLTARHLGRLVGVAPFYRRHVGGPGRAGSAHLRVFGAGRHGELTELPGILVHPDWTRSVFRQFIRHLSEAEAGWDWIEVPLGHDQGWFEPEWAQTGGPGPAATVIHKGTKPCVVMPLSGDWEATLAGLKRNVRQSVHRGRNRLTRAGHRWELEVIDPMAFAAFDKELVRLHRARAGVNGKPSHPDHLVDSGNREFLERAAKAMVGGDELLPCLLRVDGKVVAARLVLRAGNTMYFSLSGFDPGFWHEGVATVLLAECLRFGAEHGVTVANFGTGVDVSKLRWCEELQRNEDFVLVAPSRKSRLAFSLYWQLRTDRIRFSR